MRSIIRKCVLVVNSCFIQSVQQIVSILVQWECMRILIVKLARTAIRPVRLARLEIPIVAYPVNRQGYTMKSQRLVCLNVQKELIKPQRLIAL